MRVWLITTGEPLPVGERQVRLMRAGILAHQLRDAGHQVTWWSSDFDHFQKRHYFGQDTRLPLADGLDLYLVHGGGYRKNISVERIRDHRAVAARFTVLAEQEVEPDVILCSYPTLELAVASTAYGRLHGVPVALDIRDLWPTLFLDYLPKRLRPLGNLALWPMWRMARRACRDASAILATSPKFVSWGLALARRAPHALDGDFPLGYVSTEPDVASVAKAETYWEDLGVDRNPAVLTVCFFGTMAGQFDLETVIDAARLLARKGVPVRFVLCGAGARLESLTARARGLDNVLLPGWVGAVEIWTLMRRADIGIAPYLNNAGFSDNYPNKTIEYLSAGLPVVSCLQGYFREFLDTSGCGMSYAMQDVDSLVAVLTRLVVTQEQRAEMAAAAAHMFSTHFDANLVYGRMIARLGEIAGL